MPHRVDDGEEAAGPVDGAGVDYGWVMQVTFVCTIIVGAPVVAVLSATTPLPTWEARVSFAVRVGAIVWFLTALSVFLYARRARDGDEDTTTDSESERETTDRARDEGTRGES
ncbi:DUF5822 domain-containing protein [Halorientalis marina]|uniref:DUF5822 domain-containing protein n=1 Tax=Halorientalis marina TaxID=2931976 RepID=UPI0035666EFA